MITKPTTPLHNAARWVFIVGLMFLGKTPIELHRYETSAIHHHEVFSTCSLMGISEPFLIQY